MTVDHENRPDGTGENDPPGIEMSIVMPFVSVASKDGPHDDNSYACGWEMGALDSELAHCKEPVLERMIHGDNAGQADLIAMRRGYTATITRRGDGWAFLRLAAVGRTP